MHEIRGIIGCHLLFIDYGNFRSAKHWKFFVVVYWNVEQASSSTARQTSRIRKTYQRDDQDLGGEISRKRQNQPGKGTSWFRTGVKVITSIF